MEFLLYFQIQNNSEKLFFYKSYSMLTYINVIKTNDNDENVKL